MTHLEQVMKEKTEKIDEVMLTLVNKFVFPQLRDPSLHILMAGGKRLRPAITVLAAEACHCDSTFVIPPACSIELMHAASLIHDDVIDNCTMRRGVQSVHLKWDVPTAVLAGDALLSVAVRALMKPLSKASIGDISLSYVSEDFIKNLDLFSKFWGEICEGKKMDIITNYTELNEETVFTLIYKKTAVLFELAGRLGANYGGATEEQERALAEYGKNLGMAFQIKDDLLGLIGDEKVLGKNVGVDITNGKKTLLVCHFLNNCSPKNKEKLIKALGNKKLSDEELKEIVDLIRDAGSVGYAKTRADSYIKKSKTSLKVLDPTPAKESLLDIVDYIMRRSK